MDLKDTVVTDRNAASELAAFDSPDKGIKYIDSKRAFVGIGRVIIRLNNMKTNLSNVQKFWYLRIQQLKLNIRAKVLLGDIFESKMSDC